MKVEAPMKWDVGLMTTTNSQLEADDISCVQKNLRVRGYVAKNKT